MLPELEVIKLARWAWTPLSLLALGLLILYVLAKRYPLLVPEGLRRQTLLTIFDKMWVLVVILAILAFSAYALPSIFFGDRVLRGVVVFGDHGETAEGAVVSVDGYPQLNYTTQKDGNFEITVPARKRQEKYVLRARAVLDARTLHGGTEVPDAETQRSVQISVGEGEGGKRALGTHPPGNFAGHIADVYWHSLTSEDRANLGEFFENTYVYTGPRATAVGPGTTFVRFEYGVAVYFKFDQDSNPGSRGEHSFFIHADESDPGRVREWKLAEHFARGTRCWKEARWANPEDRCRVIDDCREPRSGIGSVWLCKQPIAQALGRPLMCEANFLITIQQFTNGFLVVDVPEFESGPCGLSPTRTHVESYVLFKRGGSAFWDGDGKRVGSQYIDVYGPDRWPIWTCTGVTHELCQPPKSTNKKGN